MFCAHITNARVPFSRRKAKRPLFLYVLLLPLPLHSTLIQLLTLKRCRHLWLKCCANEIRNSVESHDNRCVMTRRKKKQNKNENPSAKRMNEAPINIVIFFSLFSVLFGVCLSHFRSFFSTPCLFVTLRSSAIYCCEWEREKEIFLNMLMKITMAKPFFWLLYACQAIRYSTSLLTHALRIVFHSFKWLLSLYKQRSTTESRKKRLLAAHHNEKNSTRSTSVYFKRKIWKETKRTRTFVACVYLIFILPKKKKTKKKLFPLLVAFASLTMPLS